MGRPRSRNGGLGDRLLPRGPPQLQVPSPGHLRSPAVALHTSHHRAACISPFFCARAVQTLGELTAQAQRQPRRTGRGEGAAGLCPRHPGLAAVTSVRLGCHPWSSPLPCFPLPLPGSPLQLTFQKDRDKTPLNPSPQNHQAHTSLSTIFDDPNSASCWRPELPP